MDLGAERYLVRKVIEIFGDENEDWAAGDEDIDIDGVDAVVFTKEGATDKAIDPSSDRFSPAPTLWVDGYDHNRHESSGQYKVHDIPKVSCCNVKPFAASRRCDWSICRATEPCCYHPAFVLTDHQMQYDYDYSSLLSLITASDIGPLMDFTASRNNVTASKPKTTEPSDYVLTSSLFHPTLLQTHTRPH